MKIKNLVISNTLTLNVAVNMASQIYVMGIGFLMAPVYLSYMGREAYGLVGFFTMLSALFVLLDVGMSPTVVREVAVFRGGQGTAGELLGYLRACELIFWVVASFGAISLVASADWIGARWLKPQTLTFNEVVTSIQLIGMIIPIRWASSYYKAVVNGFERQAILACINVAFSTTRFVIVVLVLHYFSNSPVSFFSFQLLNSIGEIIVLALAARSTLPQVDAFKIRWRAVAARTRSMMVIGGSATIWICLTQSDKLLLSSSLSLQDYGAFTLAITAASCLSAINAPFNQAILPRMTKLFALGDLSAALKLYNVGMHVLVVISIPAVLVMTMFGPNLLAVWTRGNESLQWVAPIMALYAAGNFFVSIHSFAYYIQYASGSMRVHLICHIVMLAVIVPCYIFAWWLGSAYITAATWFTANFCYFLIVLPLIYRRNFGKASTMLTRLTLVGLIGTIIAALQKWLFVAISATPSFISLCVVYGTVVVACAASSHFVRPMMFELIASRWRRVR